jgi:hypothetical protein
MCAMHASEAVVAALAGFPPASSELVEQRQLLRRIDSKYVVDAGGAAALVTMLAGTYAVLPVAGGCIATYRNLYFDTDDLRCFHDHRRGRRIRHKVRIRHYPDRALSYLEIKTKRNELVTDKQRHAIPFANENLGDSERAFIRTHAGALADALRPSARIEYRRVCLIGLASEERVTIDLDLEIVDQTGTRHSLTDIAIIEVKRPPVGGARTPARLALLALRARERSLSKYCAAIALTHPEIRQNRLRPNLRVVEALR